MAPPPATPSPHRFVASKRESRPARPPSSLRNPTFATPPRPAASSPAQFQSTPRFSFRRPDGEDAFAALSSHARPAPPRPTQYVKPSETIEDVSQEDAGGDSSDQASDTDNVGRSHHSGRRVVKSIEDQVAQDAPRQVDDEEGAGEELLYNIEKEGWPSPKRRRISTPPEESHMRPLEDRHSHAHRFLSSQFNAPAPTPSVSSITRPRRAFVLPPTPAVQQPVHPLPEAFSPHRRGEKFLPNGLAATVRQWVMDVGNESAAARSRTHHPQDDGVVARLVITETSRSHAVDGGMALVLGHNEGNRLIRVLVVGRGTTAPRNTAHVELRKGSSIGVRQPCWTTTVEGQEWLVAPSWGVLSNER